MKILQVFLAALLLNLGFFLLFGSISILGNGNLVSFSGAIICAILSLLWVGWVNSHSWRRTFVGTIVGLGIGVPLAMLVLAPLAHSFLTKLTSFAVISEYGVFDYVWYILAVIVVIELITAKAYRRDRLPGLLIGVVAGLLVVIGIELATANQGQTSERSFWKLMIYIPFLWICVVISPKLFSNKPT